MSKKEPATEMEWLELADEVISAARDAAKSGEKARMRSAAQKCLDFVSSRTLECPREAAEAVAAVQVELSQLIVRDDIGSIKSRTTQFDAYLQDIQRLTLRAEHAADLISFKSARKVVSGAADVVTQLRTAVQKVRADDPDAAAEAVKEAIAALEQLQEDFDALRAGGA
jgi:hypothetical protein